MHSQNVNSTEYAYSKRTDSSVKIYGDFYFNFIFLKLPLGNIRVCIIRRVTFKSRVNTSMLFTSPFSFLLRYFAVAPL